MIDKLEALCTLILIRSDLREEKYVKFQITHFASCCLLYNQNQPRHLVVNLEETNCFPWYTAFLKQLYWEVQLSELISAVSWPLTVERLL